MSEIQIRAFEMADWEDVSELFLAPECQRGTLQLPYQSRDDIKHKLENPPPNFHRLVAVLPESKRVVGIISVHSYQGRRSHTGDIGMFVHDDYHNRGIGTALLEALLHFCDNWLGLERIELTVYVDNPGAVHLYEKCGFDIEGRLRGFARRDGIYVDAFTMARLSPQLFAQVESAMD